MDLTKEKEIVIKFLIKNDYIHETYHNYLLSTKWEKIILHEDSVRFFEKEFKYFTQSLPINDFLNYRRKMKLKRIIKYERKV